MTQVTQGFCLLVPKIKQIRLGLYLRLHWRVGKRCRSHFISIDKGTALKQFVKLARIAQDVAFGQQQFALLITHIPGQRRTDVHFGTGQAQDLHCFILDST